MDRKKPVFLEISEDIALLFDDVRIDSGHTKRRLLEDWILGYCLKNPFLRNKAHQAVTNRRSNKKQS